MHRQIVLDTETTGIRVEDGHRIIEVGCVELIDRKLTGNHFHYYINPNREIEADAFAVHGISNEFLQDKPTFDLITEELISFLSGSELIIHNATFDISFLDYEIALVKKTWKTILDYCRVIDTLQMARKQFVGQRNNLDALCKRLKIDNSKRDLHGALLDAHLLAQVYLVMTGGQGSFFDALSEREANAGKNNEVAVPVAIVKQELFIRHATEVELNEHDAYLKQMHESGKCIWLDMIETPQ